MERFRKLRSQCNVQFLELEYANIAVGNMHLPLREKLIAQECSYLTQLATRASRIKYFILEKEQKRANRVSQGLHLIFIIDINDPGVMIDSLEK